MGLPLPRNFVECSLRAVYPAMVGENSIVLRLLENAFASQKIKSRDFYLCPSPLGKTLPRVLIIRPQPEGNNSFPPGSAFLEIYFKPLPCCYFMGKKIRKVPYTEKLYTVKT